MLDHNDAMAVSALAAATVMVLRTGAHTEEQIVDAVKRLKRAGGNVVGGILNTVVGDAVPQSDSLSDTLARAAGQPA
ncbi:cryptic autophosphorylating protein tyrosine kinase Etk [compost metagenome]